MWFLNQFKGQNSAYILSKGFRFLGQYNPAWLSWSIAKLVERHESLRTSFVLVDGQPVQQIADTLPVSLPVVDLSGLEQDIRQAELAWSPPRS